MKTRLTKRRIKAIKVACDLVVNLHLKVSEEVQEDIIAASRWAAEMLQKKESENGPED